MWEAVPPGDSLAIRESEELNPIDLCPPLPGQ